MGGGLSAAVLWLAMAAGAAQAAPRAPQTAEADGGDTLTIIYKLKADCKGLVPQSGEGSQASPVYVRFGELFGDQHHCKWVKVRATASTANYYDYLGRLHGSIEDLYFTSYLNYGSVWIASFADPAFDVAAIDRADVTVAGIYGELCGEGGDADFVFGPCHYGPAGALYDVSVQSAWSPAHRRIVGEANREVIGNVRFVDRSWSELANVRGATRAWLRALRKGPDAFRLHLFGPIEALDAETREFALAPESRHNQISRPDSALRKAYRGGRRVDFEVFHEIDADPDVYSEEDDEEELSRLYSCICAVRACDAQWPILSADLDKPWTDFVCIELERNAEGWRPAP
jgi:hypothetical protein